MNIPVSPFTKNCIISTHGIEPVEIRATDPLASQLTCHKPGSEAKLTKLKTLLTESIDIAVSPLMQKNLAGVKLYRVGMHLDDYFRDRLNAYVHAREELGAPIGESIKKWCAEHDVEIDTDISFDALYKDYQRYRKNLKEKKADFFARKTRECVRKNGQRQKPEILLLDHDLDQIIDTYEMSHPTLFLTYRGELKKILRVQLRCYVYRVIGKRTPQYVCQKFNIPRTYRTDMHGKKMTVQDDFRLRRHIRSFKMFLLTAPPILY